MVKHYYNCNTNRQALSVLEHVKIYIYVYYNYFAIMCQSTPVDSISGLQRNFGSLKL